MTRLINVNEKKIFIRVIKSRRMRWAGNVARMGHRRVTCTVSVGRSERDHWEGLRVDGRIILKLIFKKWDGQALNGLICLWNGTGGWRL